MSEQEKAALLDNALNVIHDLAKAFVSHPEALELSTGGLSNERATLNVVLKAHANDISKLIGREQAMFVAMRYLTGLAVSRITNGSVMFLVSNEPTTGVRDLVSKPFALNPKLNLDPYQRLLDRYLSTIGCDPSSRKDTGRCRTCFKVECAADIAQSLSVVLRAIGKTHGWLLAVEAA